MYKIKFTIKRPFKPIQIIESEGFYFFENAALFAAIASVNYKMLEHGTQVDYEITKINSDVTNAKLVESGVLNA